MTTNVAHKRWWQIFEVVFGVPLLVAIALQLVFPISLPLGPFTPAVIFGGVALSIIGTIVVVLARRQFVQHRQPTDPGQPTTQLITTGVFSISRNPLYLGGICAVVGIALALDIPWVLLLLLPACVGCHYMLILPEERYLTTKFSAQYQTYAACVHRWIGRA